MRTFFSFRKELENLGLKMTNDERNFRSSYYEKVGCRGVEEKKSLEILLKEKPWDKMKLKQFCLRFTLPVSYRNLMWKVLLDMLPVYADSHKFVLDQRQAQYNDLLHALKTMKIIDNSTSKPQQILALWFLETGKLYYDFNLQAEHGIMQISETMLQMYDDDVEVYWLSKGLYEFVEHFGKDIPRLIECFKSILEKEDQEIYKFFQDRKAFEVLPLERWFNCCFAGVLDESALAKIWDKLCGGSPTILAFVALVLVITLRRNILRCKEPDQILKCISEIPDEAGDVIANKSIDFWQLYGSMLPGQNEPVHAVKAK